MEDSCLAYVLGRRKPPSGSRPHAATGSERVFDPRITVRLPERGEGFQTFGNRRYPPGAFLYGRPETIQALKRIGRMWRALAGDSPPIGIGDISRRGGVGGHPVVIGGRRQIWHRTGLEVDVLPVRGDGRPGAVDRRNPAYSRRLTQQLVDAIRGNGWLGVRRVLFNDPGIRGARACPFHDDHLHVHFETPPGSCSPAPYRQRR
jgi:murein endopeptidase